MSLRPDPEALQVALRDHGAFLHFLIGPRQVGKTTAARALCDAWPGPVHYASADAILPPNAAWLSVQWGIARRGGASGGAPPLLVLDEVQKIPRWSDAIKALWDDDRWNSRDVRVLCLGSSALLLQHGLTESLAGRYLLHRCSHWGLADMRSVFGYDLERWLVFGGYPGAARLDADPALWRRYVLDALIESAIARDVLALQAVAKPALLRQLFGLACHYPGQALSYTKMLGQLQEAGNVTTLAHYLELLAAAFLVTGLKKWSPGAARRRGSSPKLVVWNNALVSAVDGRSPIEARADPAWWGRLVDNAVGAHLLQHFRGLDAEVFWWRERQHEVDYVVRSGRRVWAVEVKSGGGGDLSGLEAFVGRNPGAQPLVVGTGGMPLEVFFLSDPRDVFR